MGIRFNCDGCGKKLHVKAFLAGKKGVCPHCGGRVRIPLESQPRQVAGSAINGTAINGTAINGTAINGTAINGTATAVNSDGEVSVPAAQVPDAQTGSQAAHRANPSATQAKAAGSVANGNGNGHAQDRLEHPLNLAGLGSPAGNAADSGNREAAAADPASVPVPRAVAVDETDVIRDAPEAVWYVRPPTGGQYGPASGEIMRKWLTEGRVSADTIVWREGWTDWREAAAVFPQFQAAVAGVSTTPPAPIELPAVGESSQHGQQLPAHAGNQAASSTVRQRRKGNKHMAVAMIATLAVVSLLLIVVLVVVLNQPAN